MRYRLSAVIAVLLISATPATAKTCFPVAAEVVSLGEANARAYTERALEREIAQRKGSLEASGTTVGRVTQKELDCAPYPNLIGADEWRCAGEARVCAAK